MYVFSLSLSFRVFILWWFSFCLCLFCLACSCFKNLMIMDTLIILFGNLVIVWLFCETELCFILYFPHMRLWFVFSILGIYRLILLWCYCLMLQLVDSRLWLNCSRATTCIGLVLECKQFICVHMFCHWLPNGEISRF